MLLFFLSVAVIGSSATHYCCISLMRNFRRETSNLQETCEGIELYLIRLTAGSVKSLILPGELTCLNTFCYLKSFYLILNKNIAICFLH